jgi:hypothetical protein
MNMPEVPSPEWTVEQYEQWLRDAIEYLQNQWAEEEGPSRCPWTGTARRCFVERLRLSESQVDTATEFIVLRSFLTYVDERFSDDAERRATLLDANQRRSILDECVRNAAGQWPVTVTQRVDTFYWVTDDRAKRLGADWQNLLRKHLDATYPDWQRNTTPENLLTWLDMYWSRLVPGQAPQAPAPVADDPRALTWVTSAQRARLERFRASRGAWTSWLPGQLDTWWPDWAKSTPDLLAPWLDQALPALGDPPAPEAGEQVPPEAEVLDELRNDDALIKQLADQSGVTEDAVRTELAAHSADIRSELAKFMQETEKELGLR